MTNDLTTLICLFHHQDQAQAALEDILKAGIPEPNVTLIGRPGSQIAASRSTLSELNVPEKDVQHLLDGISAGGAVLAVSAISDHAEKVESIFANHKAGKIDEATVADDMSAQALPYAGTPQADYAAVPLAAPAYDPLLPSELTREGEDLVLVTGTIDADGIAHIDSVQPVESVTPASTTYLSSESPDTDTSEDLDPRQLGLDARMKPSTGSSQVQ